MSRAVGGLVRPQQQMGGRGSIQERNAGERRMAGDSPLSLTLQPLCPGGRGDIRWCLALSLLALVQLFFVPPTRRPGGAGNRRQSSARAGSPPPRGACAAWPQPHQGRIPAAPWPRPTHLCRTSARPLPGPPEAWGLPGTEVWGWPGVKGTRCDVSIHEPVFPAHAGPTQTEMC